MYRYYSERIALYKTADHVKFLLSVIKVSNMFKSVLPLEENAKRKQIAALPALLNR